MSKKTSHVEETATFKDEGGTSTVEETGQSIDSNKAAELEIDNPENISSSRPASLDSLALDVQILQQTVQGLMSTVSAIASILTDENNSPIDVSSIKTLTDKIREELIINGFRGKF